MFAVFCLNTPRKTPGFATIMRKIELKEKATKALFAIVFFIFSYLVLLLAAIGLAILTGIGGIALVALKPHFITLALGLGMIGMGIFVLFFLIKFIFKSTKTDLTGMVEIKEKDEPKIFELVRAISSELKTAFPKHIYLTPDVNASVFYNSNFWSMFFPTGKNLQIGLGLVNAVTESELKAILAHEFGHFSQKSMSIGSYVYNVNQVIHNLVNDNESFDNMINRWANASGYFTIFAGIAIRIIKGIQWILVKLYTIVNLSYLELSREMEFEADEIAAGYAGSQPLIDSLQRLDFAESSYQQMLDFYNSLIQENRKAENMYHHHAFVMGQKAKAFELPIKNNLPYITEKDVKKFHASQLVIKNQWSSHPTTSERVQRLEELNIVKELSNETSWNFFKDKNLIQKKITDKLFERVAFSNEPEEINLEVFTEIFFENEKKWTFSSLFNGFYDGRDPSLFIQDQITKESLSPVSDLFGENSLDLIRKQNGLRNDAEVLKQIEIKAMDLKTFDYDGKRYSRNEAGKLASQLKEEADQIDLILNKTDRKFFALCLEKAGEEEKKELQEVYKTYYNLKEQLEKDSVFYEAMLAQTRFIQDQTPFDKIVKNMKKLKEEEVHLKNRLSAQIVDKRIDNFTDNENKERITHYLSKDWVYFTEPDYNDGPVELFFQCLHLFISISSQQLFEAKKNLLDYQAQIAVSFLLEKTSPIKQYSSSALTHKNY